MNPIAWLVSLVLPACGFPGAQGLATPVLMNVTKIVRPSTPNTALAAPAGFKPAPDIVTPAYNIAADKLLALIQDVAASQLRVYPAANYTNQLQVHYVARSPVFNFPDLVMVQVVRTGSGSSSLVIYSRSVYGQSDLGVNRKRLDTWLAALNTKLPSPSER